MKDHDGDGWLHAKSVMWDTYDTACVVSGHCEIGHGWCFWTGVWEGGESIRELAPKSVGVDEGGHAVNTRVR